MSDRSEQKPTQFPFSRPPVLSSSPRDLGSSVCTTLEKQRPQIETSKDAYPTHAPGTRPPVLRFSRSHRLTSPMRVLGIRSQFSQGLL